jgi:hypothetical protein
MTSAAPETPAKSPFKNPFLYSGTLILLLAAYVGYTVYSRHQSTRDFEKRTEQQLLEKRRDDDRRAIEQLGGSDLSFRALYVTQASIHRGEKSQLCYDVTNAKTVTLDPPEGEVWPSHSRCLDLAPQKSTTYTLTITDATGKSASQSVQIQVR